MRKNKDEPANAWEYEEIKKELLSIGYPKKSIKKIMERLVTITSLEPEEKELFVKYKVGGKNIYAIFKEGND